MVRPDGSGPGRPPEGEGGSGGQTPTATPRDGADTETDDQAETDLDSMTKDELIQTAESRGITVSSSMTKDEIRRAIDAA